MANDVQFTPHFLLAHGSDGSTGATYLMNSDYFADEETAKAISAMYGTGEVRQVSMLGPGPFVVDTKMFEFKLEDGRWANAGTIAAYYVRNPAELADKMIRNVLYLPPAPPKPPVTPPIKPIPANTYIGPRDQHGAYSGQGDTNPPNFVIDDPWRPGINPLIKVEKVSPFGGDKWKYWIDAPEDAVVGQIYTPKSI